MQCNPRHLTRVTINRFNLPFPQMLIKVTRNLNIQWERDEKKEEGKDFLSLFNVVSVVN